LPIDVKDEVVDLFRFLEKITDSLWRKPEYDPLNGEPDISELRAQNVSVRMGGRIRTFTPRIYGFFGLRNREYTFLHGTNKRVRNDIHGKEIARDRLRQLREGIARVRGFEF
jgi:hypothetical protein